MASGTIKEELCAAMDTMIEEVNVVLVFSEQDTRMEEGFFAHSRSIAIRIKQNKCLYLPSVGCSVWQYS